MIQQVVDKTLRDSDFRLLSYLRQFHIEGCHVDIPKAKVIEELGWTRNKLESSLQRLQGKKLGIRID